VRGSCLYCWYWWKKIAINTQWSRKYHCYSLWFDPTRAQSHNL